MSDSILSRPGVLLDVHGHGVLLQGDSGVGKSDLALGLVARGHRLVADDLVEFQCCGGELHGRCRSGFEGILEISGLGLINLKQLYGEGAVCASVALTLVLTLEPGLSRDYDGLQPVAIDWCLLDVAVPAWRLPYSNQRDMPLLVETALRLNRARQQGYDACSDLQSRLSSLLHKGAA